MEPRRREPGHGKIVADYRPEDVFSVALPVLPEGFYNFTMDPQGLRQIMQEEGGEDMGDYIRAANESGENLKIHITYAVDRVTDTHGMAIERGILNIDPATGMLVP